MQSHVLNSLLNFRPTGLKDPLDPLKSDSCTLYFVTFQIMDYLATDSGIRKEKKKKLDAKQI